ncbi:hypothetical protein O7621_23510 [Solwaraspora sp. WMMD937]|uniref:hypothetical protein n=1 Tax=Solwaraspora sp. WMMD937 TaxID=3016090 RepID=UPI00249B844E|nr:hypothetical protein [Solwaraspora sp. WMMD937]WFE20810.1 hypothetical protein O7621_23510 [Solwaraspora sp. WMMD937]
MIENWRGRLSGLRTRAEDSAPPITFPAELRSCHPYIAFDATFQFWWKGDDRAAFWTARRKITEWADQVTARYCVTQAGNAENEINARISSGVRVQLTVGRRALAAAQDVLEINRQAALECQRQRAELDRIRFLREKVYSRPDVARSYWLFHHPDQLKAMLEIDFEGIAEKFGNTEDSQFLVIAKLIGEFLGRLEDADRRYLVGQLGQLFSSYDRSDLAELLEDS